ncbi:MAG: nicotinate-nucleotide adenylyltransferase [Phycisphaerae bacterium]|nr:nicotinate-nucleotide adenylyltransferase [Phycisphaerae bacterium]
MRIGLYGGRFDPIHYGHLIAAQSILEQLRLDRVIFVPCGKPPHKPGQSLSNGRHRVEMIRLAIQDDSRFDIDEFELNQKGPSYTFATVSEFRKRLGDSDELFWLIGADSLSQLPTWYRIGELVRIVQIVTAARPGWQPPPLEHLAPTIGTVESQSLLRHVLQTPHIEISSTEIRQRAASNLPIRYFLPAAVDRYIREFKLYQGNT